MNTPLQVISFQLELLEQKIRQEEELVAGLSGPPASQLKELLEYQLQKFRQLQEEVERLQDMVQRLVAHSIHESQEEHCYLDLNQVFQDELNLYQADLFYKHRVEKEFHLIPGLPPIHGRYVDFSQSFRNFVDNALEAMVDSSRRVLTVITLFQDNCRVVRIGDTGCGIPPSVQAHLFEPFFSTKGTIEKPRAVLSLFMARRLLKPYGGDIMIESQPGQTWVTVYLPAGGEN